jgi:hypothetical protein
MSYFTRLTGWLGFTPKDAAKSADVPAPTPSSEPVQEPARPLVAVDAPTPATIAGG